MFKRVLLLVVLMILLGLCLVGGASALSVGNGDLEGWMYDSTIRSSGTYFYREDVSGAAVARYYLDDPNLLNSDFTMNIHISAPFGGTHANSNNTAGSMFVGIGDSGGRDAGINWVCGYVNPRSSAIIYSNSSESVLTNTMLSNLAAPSMAMLDFDATIVRDGANITLSDGLGGAFSYPFPNDLSDSPYIYVHFSRDSGYTLPDMRFYSVEIPTGQVPPVGQPCTINVYDADSRLPLAGAWDYYVVIEGADAVSGSASGASKAIYLPATSVLQPHLLRVTKEGYVQVPEILAINVPVGGREIPVYLRSTTAAPEEGNVWLGFTCTDADTGSPVSSALVNLDGSAQYTGASGYVRFQVPMNSTHEWVASSSSHWPMGGTVTVETVDLNVPVELVGKTSDLPRPPLPDLPNFPVIHPNLDPAVFRAQILNVPILGGLASPLLDTMDAVAVGLDDIVQPVLDFVTAPADNVVEVLSGVGDQLTESVATYTDIAGVLLGSVGKLLGVFPDLVVGLVTYNLVLDLVYLLLRGGL